MDNFLIVMVVLAFLACTVIGFFWSVVKILGFLGKLLEGGSPTVSTPAYVKRPASPPRPEVPVSFLSSTLARSENDAARHTTRKLALQTVRFEVQRAFNLGLIPRDTYLAMGRYLDREKLAVNGGAEIAPTPDVIPESPPQPQPMAPATASAPADPLPLLELMETATPSPTPEPTPEAVPPVPVAETVPAAQTAAVPELQPVQESAAPVPVPFEDEASAKNLARVRSAIAKLHEHAQAPEEPAASLSQDAEAMEARVAISESLAPSPLPQPAEREVPAVATPAPALFKGEKSSAIKKSWAERLFTPENVRILQSLGICIMFISAVAFVRTQMWNDALPLTRMLILLAGTVACSGTGYALRRWLSLRITGLGFLILGQLSVVLDAYTVLLTPAMNGHPIYPYSPASLWTVSFIVFAIIAAVKARVLKEPLFDAFAYFGGLAAWGAAALWAGVDPYLLPATFVPALLVSALLAQFVKPKSFPAKPTGADAENESAEPALRVPRWSMPWWLAAGFEFGAVLLAVILPVAAELSGARALSAHFAAHASAMVGLALSIFVVAQVQIRNGQRKLHSSIFHAAALLLLLPAPMAAWAFAWKFPELTAAFALPGACLALVGLGLQRLWKSEANDTPQATLAPWGLAATVLGVAGAAVLRCQGHADPALLLSAGAALSVALAFALWRDEMWGPFLATFSAALMASIVLERAHLPSTWIPVVGGVLALLSHAGWTALKRTVSPEGRMSSDVVALLSGLALLTLAPFFPTGTGAMVGATAQVSFGWLALFAFVLATSLWDFTPFRRGLGIALSAPALAYTCYHAGFLYGSPAPWLAVLALAAVVLCHFFSIDEGSGFGVMAIFAHGTLLAGYQFVNGFYAPAALSFGLLALALLVHSQFQRARHKNAWAAICETGALGYLSFSGVCLTEWSGLDALRWPLALTLLGAAVLVFAKIGEILSVKLHASTHEGERPFRAAAPIVALALSAAAFVKLLILYSWSMSDSAMLLTLSWSCGLLPLFIAFRTQVFETRKVCKVSADATLSLSAVGGALLAAAFGFVATLQLLRAEFWLPMPACTPQLRLACAAYLAVILLVSVLGTLRNVKPAAIPGMLASLGLIGCACGQWTVPDQIFALGAAMLVYAATWLSCRENEAEQHDASFETAAWIASGFAQFSLTAGLLSWSVRGTQYLAVAAWLVLAAARWQKAEKRRYAALAMAAIAFAVAHGMRWMGLEFHQFGPGLVGTALLILGAAEGIRMFDCAAAVDEPRRTGPSRANSIILVAALTGVAGTVLGFVGGMKGQMWQWSATLLECALGVAAATLIVRRNQAASGNALPEKRVLLLELSAWLLLTFSLIAAANVNAANIPVSGPTWALIAAAFLLLGMAAEAIVGALTGAQDSQKSPAFLESRHLAALGIGAVGLISAFFHGNGGDIHLLWRTLLALTTLAVYGGFARISSREKWNDLAQKFSGGLAYVVLLPLGYLNFLNAHSNGGPWGGMYFMLLCPILLAAQYVLRREKRDDQAALANFGAWMVSAGAVVLAFVGNRQELSAVPAAVLAVLALQFLATRAMTGKRGYTTAVCAAVVGSTYFALQALVGFPLFGSHNPWAWQMPLLSLLGVAMIMLGGSAKLDEIPLESGVRGKPAQGSIVALSGLATTGLALMMSVLYVFGFGVRAHFPLYANMGYLDAVIASTLLLAAATLCAKRWLADWSSVEFVGKYLPPVATLAAYLMFVLKAPPHAAEWYSVPMAVFFFSWAWQSIAEAEKRAESRHEKHDEREAAVLLMIASALTVIPSFIQELPNNAEGTHHFFAMLGLSIAMVFGAMLSRRKIPLLGGSAGVVVGTIIKCAQWAHHHDGVGPLLGILVGLILVAGSTLLESRMNQAFRKVVDRARAEARMFWVSWQ